MRRFVFLVSVAICFLSGGRLPEPEDSVIFNRIEYVFSLKSIIRENVWKDFDDDKFDLPLIYYADTCCYVTNPTEDFLNRYRPDLVHENGKVKIYKTFLLDSIPFHMQVSITFGDPSGDYDYKSPFMKCSSVETTCRTIPGVSSTEEWAMMVLHEYFHGFQFRHPDFLVYFEQNVMSFVPDSIKYKYKSGVWFKESIDRENSLLLAALESTDDRTISDSIDAFFRIREQRRERAKREFGFDVGCTEKVFETMEGTARYIEYNLRRHFAAEDTENGLLKSDPCFHADAGFRDFKLENAKWMYRTDKSVYFYATGFNIVRLLDKLGVDYKSRLFNEGGMSLERLLREYHNQRLLK